VRLNWSWGAGEPHGSKCDRDPSPWAGAVVSETHRTISAGQQILRPGQWHQVTRQAVPGLRLLLTSGRPRAVKEVIERVPDVASTFEIGDLAQGQTRYCGSTSLLVFSSLASTSYAEERDLRLLVKRIRSRLIRI
jgi:hypothetical protein